MSAPNDGDGRADVPDDRQSVLGNLPRTRPQRSSARRTAARRSTAAPTAADGEARPKRAASRRSPKGRSTATPARAGSPKGAAGAAGKQRKARASSRRASSPPKQAVPSQGFETEADRARGPVQPPGGTELIASAVEIVGDLAKSGLSSGERVLKSVFSRLSP
jgi:hypothetical protein